jgi:[acyl-carrier-protein] S-malonyltransferase
VNYDGVQLIFCVVWMAKKVALVFPGQGSQAVGMGRSVYEEFSVAKAVMQEAVHSLGYDLQDIMFNDPGEKLVMTKYTQPAMLTASTMIFSAMNSLYHEFLSSSVICAIGHSVGEYSALVAAGCIPFDQAINLVNCRACAMAEASPTDEFMRPIAGMCAVLGMDKISIQRIIDEYSAAIVSGERMQDSVKKQCYISNDNCHGQVVISGLLRDIEFVSDLAIKNGAKKCVTLPVSGPFHCKLMEHAENVLREAVCHINFRTGTFPVFSNVAAEPFATADIDKCRDLLVKQVVSPVRWRECIEAAVAMGVDTIIEVGNGQVLAGLCRRCAPECRTLSVQNSADVMNLANVFAHEN